MTNRKNNNSMIFLTTLGVYLGLLLVGGSAPQVFAHSAMTRDFEIQDEIEVKDDLDNKPDDETALEAVAASLEDIYRAAAKISSDHPDWVNESRYDFDYFVSVNPKGGGQVVSKPEFNNGPKVHHGTFKPLKRLYDAFLPRIEEHHERFFVSFDLSPDDIALKVIVDADASKAAFYGESLSRHKETEISVLRSLIYESTTISFEGNKIVIVTRLPRGSIDPLLAKDAK